MKQPAADFTAIIADIQNGSQQAAWDLVAEYGDLVMRVVRRQLPRHLRRVYDSRDFVQVAWKSVFRHRSRLSRFTTAEEFTAFLANVALNKVREEARRRLHQTRHGMTRDRSLETFGGDFAENAPTASQVAIARETWFQLLEKQPAPYREIVRMRYLGHSFQEIADRVGFDEGHVRRVLRKMFQKMTR